jgi:GT2 family glycosyltransferase
MKIGAGIYHYRRWPEVCGPIEALIAQSRSPDQIVVYDHASGDGSAEKIRSAFPDIEVVEAPDNRGQVAGENRIRRLLVERGFDAVYVAPDDLELAPDALERMEARLLEAPDVGAVGPLVAYPDDRERIWGAGGYVRRDNWALEFCSEPPRVSDWQGLPPKAVDFIQTGGMLMRSEVAREAGDMSEHYYYWMEDVDYTLHINSLGWKVECLPDALAWEEFGSPPRYIWTRNRLLLILRNAPKRMVVREVARQLYHIARDAMRPSNGERKGLWARFRGVLDFCLRRWGPPPERLMRTDAAHNERL